MTGDPRLVRPFPAPPGIIDTLLEELRLTGAPANAEEHQRLVRVPKPWDPAACPPDVRAAVWEWLDAVVDWLNTDHTWRTDQAIPTCWPEHPHLIHELALLACQRHNAAAAPDPQPLADWHRLALPAFFDHLHRHTGGHPCPPGKHRDWPGAAAHRLYRSGQGAQERRRRYAADTDEHGPPITGNEVPSVDRR